MRPSAYAPFVQELAGVGHARLEGMAVHSYRELVAWQLADEFKREVIKLVLGSQPARQDFKYRTQLLNAATAVSKDVVEGFLRFSPREFRRSSTTRWGLLVKPQDDWPMESRCSSSRSRTVRPPRTLARRCAVALVRLKHSQARFQTGRKRTSPDVT